MKTLIHILLLAWLLGGSMLAAGTDCIEIDAKQTGAVISPMLFGCNLEVTRRGIWRGLGAEMVANRKFAAVSNNMPERWYPLPDAGGMANEVTPQHTIFLEREEQPTVNEGGRLELKMPKASVAVL